jgi:opacity protein-like surface antigen
MKRFHALTAGVAALGLSLAMGQASAQTVPVSPAFDGFFVGGHVGDTVRPAKTITAATPASLPVSSGINFAGRGGQSALFGFSAGYNWTVGGMLFGAEFIGDLSPNGGHWSENGTLNSFMFPNAPTTMRTAVYVNGALQTRARLGYVFNNSIAAYGFAGVGLDFVSYRFADNGARIATPSYGASRATLGTWGVGLGAEWLVASNIAIRGEVEYRRSLDSTIWAGSRYDTGRYIARLGATYLFGR